MPWTMSGLQTAASGEPVALTYPCFELSYITVPELYIYLFQPLLQLFYFICGGHI